MLTFEKCVAEVDDATPGIHNMSYLNAVAELDTTTRSLKHVIEEVGALDLKINGISAHRS